jgi:membrane fusion protein, heavy metal efflux system
VKWNPRGWLVVVALVCCKDKAAEATAPAAPKKSAGVDVELSAEAFTAARLKFGIAARSPRHQVVLAAGMLDFAPNRVARLGPSASGRIASLTATVGQRVKRGSVLATVDSVDAGRARADVLAARSRLAQADSELSRERRLTEGGAASERSLAVAQSERNLAEVEVRAAEARTQTLGTAVAGGALGLVSPMDGTVLEVRARLGQPVSATDTLIVVGEVDSLWLRIDVYERDVGRIRVGDAARIVTLAYPDRVFEGRVEQLGTAIDPERHVLDARIVLSNADGALRPGMSATARILGRPLELSAQPLDAGPTTGARTEPAAQTPTVVSVPKSAIQTIDGQPFVFVAKRLGSKPVTDGSIPPSIPANTTAEFELRAVERGSALETEVEILRGLEGGEPIVVDGAFILKSELLKSQMGTND